MRNVIVVSAAILMANSAVYAADAGLKNQKDKLSYTLGVQVGQDFKSRGVDMNTDAFVMAVKDMLDGKEPRLSRDEMQAAMDAFRVELNEKFKKKAVENKTKGEAYLKENKSKKGVTELPSGLQYRVIKTGTGKKPELNDKVSVHYRGTLITGKEFDSSIARGQPATFPVSGVIKGWQDVLQLMPVGSKWEVVIPAALAYGERGAGGDIGPNETLVFEIELLDIAQ